MPPTARSTAAGTTSAQFAGRLASAGLALVLLLLAAFGGWVAFTTHQVASEVRRSAALSDAWDRAQHAVTAEESLERKYRLEPGPEVLARHRAAARALDAALDLVRALDAGEG